MAHRWLQGQSILITGACGTIASALLTEILKHEPKVVRLLDNHEHGLFNLQREVGANEKLRWLIGDVRDRERVRRAMQGVQVVFHTAALKHVELGEYNPFEIVQTNLVGLQNVIWTALECDVERVVFTSSDKAVNPSNAMGASKLMGERLVAAAQSMVGTAPTRFSSVRFGNVLGSNGSVLDIFLKQVAAGGPITITDSRMTRFVMGRENAVRLVLRAAEMAVGGELFVLRMPALRISDLAQTLAWKIGPRYGHDPERIRLVEIGPKPGEKLFEELLNETEASRAYEDDELIVYLGENPETRAMAESSYLAGMKPVTSDYHSGNRPLMTMDEISAFLTDSGLLAQAEDGVGR